MHRPEALILRRCYPVPVTFADLFLAYHTFEWTRENDRDMWRRAFSAALKRATSAIDEVYAVVDGREVRVGVMTSDGWQYAYDPPAVGARAEYMDDLFDSADRAGYWERPHEVRLDLQTRPVSHDSVARAVLVGQEYLERTGGAR